MTGAGPLNHTTVLPAEPEDEVAAKVRWTIIFHAPFDRVYALTSVGAMGMVLACAATPAPVRVAGVIIAAVTLPWACWLLVRELRIPRDERAIEFEEQLLTDRPLPYVDTIGRR